MVGSKVSICGAGFLGSHIARTLAASSASYRIQLCSRSPSALHQNLTKTLPTKSSCTLMPPQVIDITDPRTLKPALDQSDIVISLVGLMNGTPNQFEDIQWRGAENVARAAKENGAKLIHVSAIGADVNSKLPYARTKGLGEQAVLSECPDATILRPSLVFGPEDDFFNRFSRLARILPFLPVFGGGTSRFQPIYVEDIARIVEALARRDPEVEEMAAGKIIQIGGPDILTYRQMMMKVLEHSGIRRPIVSMPFIVGTLQGMVMEKLPQNLFTITQDQVEQLKSDNIVSQGETGDNSQGQAFFDQFREKFDNSKLHSLSEVLPSYLS